MKKNSFFTIVLLFLFAFLFFYGMIELLMMRFRTGDAYPPYSSYRPDPQGTKAFYEALSRLHGINVKRNVESLDNISGGSEATLFLFGLRRSDFSLMRQSCVKRLEDAANRGGRIVITFVPAEDDSAFFPGGEKGNEAQEDDEPKTQNKEEKKERHDEEFVDLARRWAVAIEWAARTKGEAVLTAPEKELPVSVVWPGRLTFNPGDDAWRILYSRGGHPVIMERSYGKGRIVLSSESFFLSNEAMKDKRYPHLLSWLCGDRPTIIFD